MTTTHSPARRRRRWSRLSQLVLLPAAAVTATALGISAFSPAAQAADPGPGYHGSAGYVGAARYEGRNAYCIDFDIPNPIGAPTRPLGDGEALPERISKLDDLTRAQLHWVINEYGSTDDASAAAAVTIFVWSLIEPTRFGGDERPIASVPPEERDRVRQLLAELRAEVMKVTVAEELEMPSAELTLVASDDGSRVRLTVGDIPRGTLLTAVIDGAVVLPDGATTTVASAKEPETAPESPAELSMDQATSVLLQPTGDAVHVTLTASHQTNAWTPILRILLTEGRQTLIQSVPASPASAQLDITVPPKPTPPPSTPPVTTPPVETPPGETPPVSETTTPPTTPPAVETTTPPATPPASTPPAPSTDAPRTSAPSTAPTQLATTGASGPALMTGIGMGIAALGCGGWLVSRRRYRHEAFDSSE